MSPLSDDALARLRYAASAPDLSGTRYLLLDEIGRGGLCTVFLAEEPGLGRRVALKVLDVPDPSGELALRLTREAKVLARLEHPGIAPVHDVGRLPDGRVFYAMKYVEGPRLDAFAASKATVSERLRVYLRILEAVAFAHDRGILHRDLKPENIMVGPFGEVLVMDWGLAKAMEAGADTGTVPPGGTVPGEGTVPEAGTVPSGKLTSHGAVLGTPGYMAPEQARGEVAGLDERADVYALGALLAFLLGGEAPRPLLAVSAKAMAADKQDRYPSAAAVSAEIARFLEGRRVEAHPENPLQMAARIYTRHRVAFWLIGAYLVVRGTILFFSAR
jgi:serine/threonine protein kinase